MPQSINIFISYATENIEKAERLYADLKVAGHDPWMASRDILSGFDWWYGSIVPAMERCSVALLLLSKAAFHSPYCRNEHIFLVKRLVKKAALLLIPIIIEFDDDFDCKEKFSFLGLTQFLDMSQAHHYDEKFNELLRSINSDPVFIHHLEETPQTIEKKFDRASSDSQPRTVISTGRSKRHTQLIHELITIERYDTAKSLVVSPTWLETCRALENSPYSGYIDDLDILWKVAHEKILEQIQDGETPDKLADSVQFALIRTSLNTILASYPPEFIEQALEIELWSPEYALGLVDKISEHAHRLSVLTAIMKSDRLTTDQRQWAEQETIEILKLSFKDEIFSGTVALKIETLAPVIQLEETIRELSELILQIPFISERAQALAALAPRLSNSEKTKLVDAQLLIIEKTGDGFDRMQSIAHLAPLMTPDRADRALMIILSHRKMSDFDWALERLAVALDGDSVTRALEATLEVSKEERRARILSNLAPKLSGSALDIAVQASYALSSPSARMEALASLSTQLDGDKKTAALDTALAAAEAIENPYIRALGLLWKAFHQLPSDYQRKALQLSYQAAGWLPIMRRPDLRCEILGQIIFSLCQHRVDDDLLEQALRNLGHTPLEHGRAADLLSVLLPHLPENPQNYREEALDVLSDLIGLLQSKDETKPEDVVHWMSALLPYVSFQQCEAIISNAVSLIHGITNADSRNKALKSLIPKLAAEHMQKIEKLMLEPDDQAARSAALGRLARHLTGDFHEKVLQEAFEVGTSTRLSERQRAQSIARLAPYLSGTLLIQAIDVALGWEDELNRAGALAAIAETATGVPIAKLLEVALEFEDGVAKTQLLASLAPALNKKQVERCLEDALKLERPQQITKILSRLRERLSGKQIMRILKHFHETYDPLTYVEAVGTLLPRITQATQYQEMLNSSVETILAAPQKYEDAGRIVRAAATIAEFLPDRTKYHVLDHAFEAALLMEGNMQAMPSGSVPQVDALEMLAPYLTGNQVKRAFKTVREILDFNFTVSSSVRPGFQVLCALAPQMNYEQLSATLHLAFKTNNTWETVYILEALAPHLTPDLTQRADAIIGEIEGAWQRARAWFALCHESDDLFPKIQQAIAEHFLEAKTGTREMLLWSFDIHLYTPKIISECTIFVIANLIMEFPFNFGSSVSK